MANKKSLRTLIEEHDGKFIHKWNHYIEIYERYFEKYRGKECIIMEVGVSHGGSLELWRKYFGPKARIIGIDNNPKCKTFEEEGIEVYIGSQSDRKFLTKLKDTLPKVDVLIDDGGHYMDQQIITFEELFTHVKDEGVYLCEDVHTSYIDQYGGGLKRSGSYIEYTKNFIDQLHAFHSRDLETFKVDGFTRSAYCVHYYDSVVVIEKAQREKKSKWIKVGDKTLEHIKLNKGIKDRIVSFFKG